MNILLVAAGLGTRLYHETANLPKCMVQLGMHPALHYIIENLPTNATRKIVVVGYKGQAITSYLDLNTGADWIYVHQQSPVGPCNAVYLGLKAADLTQPTLILWSDIIIAKEDLKAITATEDNLFLVSTSDFDRTVPIPRYSVQTEGTKIISCQARQTLENGLIGGWWIQDTTDLFNIAAKYNAQRESEFTPILADYVQRHECHIYPVRDYYDFGTLDALEATREYFRTKFHTRVYNKLTVEDGMVIKQGPRVVEEFNWYRHVPDAKFVPEVKLKQGDLYLEEIPAAQTVYQYLLKEKDIRQVIFLLERITAVVKTKLHLPTGNDIPEADISQMYLEKPRASIYGVERFLPHDILYEDFRINSKEMRPALFLLVDVYEQLSQKLLPNPQVFIHGDLTLSNILLSESHHFYFIDPRGYFGSTPLYGDRLYDIAKLYYSLVGNFDSWNTGKYRLYIDNKDIFYYIENTGYSFLGQWLLNQFAVDKLLIDFIHATIWLSLCAHSLNDIQALTVAYVKGTEILNQVWEELHATVS